MQMMQFNSDLYCALADLFPGLTVRTLSRMMGKSLGYWSSVNAQNMPVSNSALVQILDALDIERMKADPFNSKKKKIHAVMGLITSELIRRFHEMTGIGATGSFQPAAIDPVKHYGAMPFLVSSY